MISVTDGGLIFSTGGGLISCMKHLPYVVSAAECASNHTILQNKVAEPCYKAVFLHLKDDLGAVRKGRVEEPTPS